MFHKVACILLLMETIASPKKQVKPGTRARKLFNKLRMKVRRGSLKRCPCQHHKLDGSPCLQPGSPVVIDPAKPNHLAWACRIHRNDLKRSLGLRVYRKAHQFFPRRKRVLPRVEPWKNEGISHREWVLKQTGIDYGAH